MALRTSNKLPVHIVEDHNEALPFIYSAIGSRHLPITNNCLIHLDSHPDLLVPKEMRAEIVWNKYELFNYLSIENWILPSCYSGLFNNIYWIKPPWSQQIPNGQYKIYIGSHNDKIRVDSNLYYFLSDGIYVNKDNLENKKEFNLNVTEMTNLESMKKLTNFLEKQGHYVLDIDLDFFSTSNPFSKMFKKGELYEKLKPLFSFDLPKNLVIDTSEVIDTDQIILLEKITEDRNKQLAELEMVFKHLDAKMPFEKIAKDLTAVHESKMRKIINCVTDFYSKNDIDWYLLYNAGLTCDKTELPHHISTTEDLKTLFDGFEQFLKSLKTRPIMITIARSSDDEYCPSDQVSYIEENVLDILSKIYNNLKVEKNYEKN